MVLPILLIGLWMIVTKLSITGIGLTILGVALMVSGLRATGHKKYLYFIGGQILFILTCLFTIGLTF